MPEDDFINEAGIILTDEQEFLQAWDLEAAEEDYEDGSGLVPDQSPFNPLDPWGLGPITGDGKGSQTTTPSVRSTLNPLLDWGVGPITGDQKGSQTTTSSAKSTLTPLAPWNLGPLGVGIKGPDINVAPGQSTLSPLSPWNLGPKASTLNPLDPWNLGPGGVPELGFESDQSTLRPLSPWNLGPIGGGAKGSETTAGPETTTKDIFGGPGLMKAETTPAPVKSTINPLAPWNLGPLGGGVKGPDMTVGPGQSTLRPLLPWNLGPKPSTIDPLNPWGLGQVGVDPSESTLSPLSSWHLGPIGGGAKGLETTSTEGKTTLSPWALGPVDGIKGSKPTEKSPLDPKDIFGVVGKDQRKEGESTLPPWAFGRDTEEPHLTSQSTRRPLAPWDLGVPGDGVKGVEPGQSTLNPLSPWVLGPKASTINPLDSWNMGPIESDGIKGQEVAPASSQSTINPLSPWNLGPIGGVPKGVETTAKPGQQGLLPKEEAFEEISKTPSKGSLSSEAAWGTGIMTTTPASECSATTRAPCQALTSPALSRCSGLLDPAPYQAACERELCGGAVDPQEVVCQWAGEYASQCLEDGLCLEWRRMLACPITSCQDNEHFEECGPGCDLDCHQSSCTGDGEAPACYCDTHMVGGVLDHFHITITILTGSAGWPLSTQVRMRSVPRL